MTRWQHQHSLGAGVLIGLLLDHHLWLVAGLSLAAGYLLRDLHTALRYIARRISSGRTREPSSR